MFYFDLNRSSYSKKMHIEARENSILIQDLNLVLFPSDILNLGRSILKYPLPYLEHLS